jgi:methionine aminopeptidase
MKTSEKITEISKALLAIQKEIETIKKNAVNPFYNSQYATLDEILEIVKPICNKNGVSLVQDINGLQISTMLIHESGEWIQQEGLTLPNEKNTAQGAGSAVTYGRRYSLSAMLGIATEQDDDGNGAQKPQQSQNYKNKLDFKEVQKELDACKNIDEINNYSKILSQEFTNLSEKQNEALKSMFQKRRENIDEINNYSTK